MSKLQVRLISKTLAELEISELLSEWDEAEKDLTFLNGYLLGISKRIRKQTNLEKALIDVDLYRKEIKRRLLATRREIKNDANKNRQPLSLS